MSDPAEAILVLGGTAEAAALATALAGRGYRATLSLLGLTESDQTGNLPYRVRRGRFGGVDGLADELRTAPYGRLVDASHPFASRLAHNAVAAADRAGVPHLRLLRTAWTPAPGDRWHEVDDLAAAATAVGDLGGHRVFLSVGRQGSAAFTGLGPVAVVLRTVTAPAVPPLAGATVIAHRGPFTVESELRLLREHRIDVLVTRNSGGSAIEAKLVAARHLDLPVVMVRRPAQPSAEQVTDVAAALTWVERTGPLAARPADRQGW